MRCRRPRGTSAAPCTRRSTCWTSCPQIEPRDGSTASVQPAAKRDPREAWAAPGRTTAEAAVATFAGEYGAKYERAVTCLTKDREALLTLHDVPAEHWNHVRTFDPIRACSPR